MKTNWLIHGILAGLLVFAVAGCKPKETTLSGQVLSSPKARKILAWRCWDFFDRKITSDQLPARKATSY